MLVKAPIKAFLFLCRNIVPFCGIDWYSAEWEMIILKVKIIGEDTIDILEKKINGFLEDKNEKQIINIQFFSDATAETIGGFTLNGALIARYNFYSLIQYTE
jgi:hypothetical protein